jgi:hypothetical protein
MENVSTRKPHSGNGGYVCERKARLGGHVVVYDAPAAGISTDGYRWVVMHEPSSNHVAIKTERQARELMKALAEARTIEEACLYADVFPAGEEDPTNDNPVRDWEQAPARSNPDDLQAALDRFLEDPENAPTDAGKGALSFAFGSSPTPAALRRELSYIEEALARPAEDGPAWHARRARLEARAAAIRSALELEARP